MNMKFNLYNEAGMHLNGRITYIADGTIARGECVKIATDMSSNLIPGHVVKCAAKTDTAIGVALDGAAAGEPIAIAILGSFAGTVVVKTSASVSLGALITCVGAAVASGDTTVGRALEAASASGTLIEVAHCVQK